MQTTIMERFRDGTTHIFTGEMVGDDLYTIKLKLMTTVRSIQKIHIMEMNEDGNLFPFGVPEDLMRIKDYFEPNEYFNICDHCKKILKIKKCSQYPCRYCENNVNSDIYLREDTLKMIKFRKERGE
jgi:hypothetical protein